MNRFKENYRRVREGILQTVVGHEAPSDVDFERRAQCFQQLVRDLEHVHEAMILWSDCMDALSMAGAGLGDAMSKFFATNSTPTKRSDLDTASKAYLSVQADISENLRCSVHKVLMERCLTPTTEILAVVPRINEKIAQRKQFLLDNEFFNVKYKNEINSGKDESDPKVVKAAAKMKDAAKALEDITTELLATFEEIEEARATILIPEVSSLVGCQYFFLQSSTQMMSELMSFFPQAAGPLCLLHSHKGATPYVSSKVVNNLKSAYAKERSDDCTPALVKDSGAKSHVKASSHHSMILGNKTSYSNQGNRPVSEQIPATTQSVREVDKHMAHSLPVTTASTTSVAPSIPPSAPPPLPPPKPVKKAGATSSSAPTTTGNVIYAFCTRIYFSA